MQIRGYMTYTPVIEGEVPMASPKKTLGSIIAAEQDKERPANYPAPTEPNGPIASKKGASAKPKRSKALPVKPSTPSQVGEKRRMISADLSEAQYRSLRDIADDLGCSKVEVIRAFIQLAGSDPEVLQGISDHLGTQEVHRPRGFAYLAARSEQSV